MPDTLAFSPALLDSHCIIDVRTPLEFIEDHLPGASNVPILNDAERVEIGTIHKQQGPQTARIRALELTCSRFADMVHEIASIAAGRPVLVYCWRGGLRSRSMAILLESCGYPVTQLIGGYKAFRNQVLSFFESFSLPVPLIVVHGMTGSGKTTFINGLDRSRCSTIDLEGLASHRGSAFGSVGLAKQPHQKRFDTLLWDAFRHTPADRPIVLEGESQRIGNITLPGRIYEVMSSSCKVWCSVSLDTRVNRLAEEYAHTEYREPMVAALERIRKKLGGARYAELRALLDNWDVPAAARGLMEHYYDKLYYKNRTWEADFEIDLEDFGVGEEQFWNNWELRSSA
ncbi:MAG TPA: tRNA 2-selenouridine(34) synthase MnmH [Desulfuromonadales bacterium]|nr:tRNA 2-selenouridine(34) synthase MnmH [Desulfuromonadales bacterium]